MLWNFVNQRVTLTSTLQDFCFPRLVPARQKYPHALYIVLAKPSDTMEEVVELRMQAEEITNEDIEMGEMDTPEVSFETHLRGKRKKFNEFYFE